MKQLHSSACVGSYLELAKQQYQNGFTNMFLSYYKSLPHVKRKSPIVIGSYVEYIIAYDRWQVIEQHLDILEELEKSCVS